eukprot:1110482-Pelagomonas_calceolata.AAC.3
MEPTKKAVFIWASRHAKKGGTGTLAFAGMTPLWIPGPFGYQSWSHGYKVQPWSNGYKVQPWSHGHTMQPWSHRYTV